MIQVDVAIDIARPVSEVFAFLDAEANAPRWLSRCVSLKRTTPDPKGVGSKLHYVYKEGSRQGEMAGEVTAYEPNRNLAMKYVDRMVEVAIRFDVTSSGAGTHVDHRVQITPRNFIMKLMTP